MQGRDHRPELAEVGDRVGDREAPLGHQTARLGRRHRGVRAHDGDAQRLGHRQREQFQRVIAPNQHQAARHAGRDVVGVDAARDRALALQGAGDELAPVERPAEQLADREGPRDAAGGRTAQPACQRHALFEPEPDAGRPFAGRAGVEEPQGRRGGDAHDVAGRVGRQSVRVPANAGDLDPGPVGPLRVHQVARLLQGQPEHVEAGPEVRQGRRSEDANAVPYRHGRLQARS